MVKDKIYQRYNKTAIFLYPMIQQEGVDYLIDFLDNVYLSEVKYEIHAVYRNNKIVEQNEIAFTDNPYFTKSTYLPNNKVCYSFILIETGIYVNKLGKEVRWSVEEDYDNFIQGKYSKISVPNILRILNFWQFDINSFVSTLYRRDKILYYERHKELGCVKDTCTCFIYFDVNEKNGKEIKIARNSQAYLQCKYFSNFNLPDDIELEDLPNIELETLKL